MTRFLFVRHGESLANASGHISTAPPGPALSDRGVEQSREFARRTAGLQVSAVYSSPMLRARDTAAEIAKVHALTVAISDDLSELFVGEVEGMPDEAGMRIVSAGWERWSQQARYDEPVAPGGESAVAAVCRIRQFMSVARAAFPGEQRVVTVTHGGLLHLLCAICCNVPFDYGFRNWLRNTETTELVDVDADLYCTMWGGLPVDPHRLPKVEVTASAIDGRTSPGETTTTGPPHETSIHPRWARPPAYTSSPSWPTTSQPYE